MRVSLEFTSEAGDPLDLSGYTFAAQIRENDYSTSTLVAPFTVDDSASNVGKIYLELRRSTMSVYVLPSGQVFPQRGRGAWDLAATSVETGLKETLLYGSVQFTGRPTS